MTCRSSASQLPRAGTDLISDSCRVLFSCSQPLPWTRFFALTAASSFSFHLCFAGERAQGSGGCLIWCFLCKPSCPVTWQGLMCTHWGLSASPPLLSTALLSSSRSWRVLPASPSLPPHSAPSRSSAPRCQITFLSPQGPKGKAVLLLLSPNYRLTMRSPSSSLRWIVAITLLLP